MGSQGREDSSCCGGTQTGPSVGRTWLAVRPLADPADPHSHKDKPRGPDSEWQRMGQALWQVADPMAPHLRTDNLEERRGVKQTEQPRAPAPGNKASNL